MVQKPNYTVWYKWSQIGLFQFQKYLCWFKPILKVATTIKQHHSVLRATQKVVHHLIYLKSFIFFNISLFLQKPVTNQMCLLFILTHINQQILYVSSVLFHQAYQILSSSQKQLNRQIIITLMSKNNLGQFRWQPHQNFKTGSSLILASSTNSLPLSPTSSPRIRLDDLYAHKQATLRKNNQQELKRIPMRPSNMATSDIGMREEFPREKHMSPNMDKAAQWSALRQKMPKQSFFKSRNSGGKAGTRESSEQLSTHRSEKALPSFLRNQTKSPEKIKFQKKGALCKENFKIIKRLGQGKFGSVFLAKEIYTGMIVALKVMEKKAIIKDNLLVQFIRQLKIQSFLDHPNIIKNYGYFSDQQNFYTIMELGCDGQLYDIISTGQTLTQESTSYIIGNLLQAINLMHRHKILHRDIKPQNIVLVHGNVKLCDFGWAVNKKEQLRSTFCGTPLYLSPQLLQGEKYDQKVDLWAIGILAYELHLGSSPFNINEQQDLIKIVTEDIQFPPNKAISKEFKDFIKQILKKNPKERMACKDLLSLDFIRKYRDLQTCEELCQ